LKNYQSILFSLVLWPHPLTFTDVENLCSWYWDQSSGTFSFHEVPQLFLTAGCSNVPNLLTLTPAYQDFANQRWCYDPGNKSFLCVNFTFGNEPAYINFDKDYNLLVGSDSYFPFYVEDVYVTVTNIGKNINEKKSDPLKNKVEDNLRNSNPKNSNDNISPKNSNDNISPKNSNDNISPKKKIEDKLRDSSPKMKIT